jgi:alkylation response protein AidB-like acyl-CoA dehydrogenase
MIDVYGLDEAANRWRQAATTLATEVLSAHAADVDAQAQFPTAGMTALARGGFYGLCLDTQFGGHGQGPGTFAAVVEELSCQCASTAMIYVMHVTATKVIESSTTFRAQAEVLRASVAGEHLTRMVKIFELAFPREVRPLPSPALRLVFRSTLTHTQRQHRR